MMMIKLEDVQLTVNNEKKKKKARELKQQS